MGGRAHSHLLSVAPMMDRTDRHFRFFVRLLTRRTLLYTEMITAQAILHGDRRRLLGFSPEEHPLSLQLGGDQPQDLAECARIAEGMGYDELNLNVGCPSDRVQHGSFGACLMARPERVAECVHAMRGACALPVTVKHRIGIDQLDRYEDMLRFVDIVAAAGADRFTVHARKAFLQGLSPAENRTVPPLRPELVHRLKRERPALLVEINGGIRSLEEARAQLAHVDAVMIGRAAAEEPWMLSGADVLIYGEPAPPAGSRVEVVERLLAYVDRAREQGARLHHVSRHLLTLFHGERGARAFKRHLAEHGAHPAAGAEVLREALKAVSSATASAARA